MTRNQDEGKDPLTTALLIAVRPTPRASANFFRPMASAKSRMSVMTALYPHCVDFSKTTIGGLLRGSQFVNIRDMANVVEATPFIEIGQRLEAVRKAESTLNQREWAEKHGFGVTQYNNWEKGVRRINVDEAEKLCALYGLSLDFIYRGRLSGLPENIKNAL